MIECTYLDLIEVQYDISNISSIYSIIYVDDTDEITSIINYTLINSFISKPHGIAEKYRIIPTGIVQNEFNPLELWDLQEELQAPKINLMYNQHYLLPSGSECPH